MRNKKAWIVVLSGFFAGIALALVQNKVAPSITFLMKDLDISMASAGWLSSIFNVMGMVMAIPSAFILNRFGVKASGLIALGGAIVGSLIGMATDSVTVLFVSRVIEGFGVGLISVIGPTLISMWFPAAKRGLPMGIWGTWQVVSQATTFFLGGYLTINYGWKGVWAFCLFFCVIAVVLYAWKVKSPPPEENCADIESANISIKAGFTSLSAWLMSLIFVLFCISCYGFATWVAPYWSETYGWDIDRANKWVSSLCFLCIFVGIGVGWLLDKVASKRKAIGMAALLMYGLLMFYCFRMTNPAHMLPFIVIYAILEGAVPTVLFTLCPQTAKEPALVSFALGIAMVGLNLGMIIGPPIMGAVVETFGWANGGTVLCISSVTGMVLLGVMKIHDHGCSAATVTRH